MKYAILAAAMALAGCNSYCVVTKEISIVKDPSGKVIQIIERESVSQQRESIERIKMVNLKEVEEKDPWIRQGY